MMTMALLMVSLKSMLMIALYETFGDNFVRDMMMVIIRTVRMQY